MNKFFKQNKAQGALEYLLIIAAAIMVVAIVISAMTSTAAEAKKTGTGAQNDANTQLLRGNCLATCSYLGTNCANPDSCAGKFPDICQSVGGACVRR